MCGAIDISPNNASNLSELPVIMEAGRGGQTNLYTQLTLIVVEVRYSVAAFVSSSVTH
jgi:hypothetical protein